MISARHRTREWRSARLYATIAFLVSAGGAIPAAGQVVVLQGSVVDQTSRQAISNATIQIAGRTLLSDSRGQFRFTDVSSGQHTLRAGSIGYQTLERTVVLTADTIIQITLAVSPIVLDPLSVQARSITVRGRLIEPDHGVGVMETEVRLGDQRDMTDLLGRFRINGVPAEVPTRLWSTAFGYLPVDLPIEASQDTTLNIVLQHDSVALQMIRAQLDRISARSKARRYEHLEGLSRDHLLAGRDRGTFLDVLQSHAGTEVIGRIACIVIDEREVYDSRTRVRGSIFRRHAGRWELAPEIPPLLPDQIYHLELVELPEPRRSMVLRIYTRPFMQELVAGGGSMVEQRLATSRVGGRCR